MSRRIVLGMAAMCLACNLSACAERQVTKIKWSQLQAAGDLKTGEVVAEPSPNSEAESLLIDNADGKALSVGLTTILPRLSSHLYAVRFRVRYEDVSEPGYFEIWNHFPGGAAYFSRTMSPGGPMGVIQGTSDWRDCVLPFQGSAETGPPERLELSLVLPSTGKVWIGPLTLAEYTESEFASVMNVTGAWWGPRQAGILGGILGTVLGVLGAIVGTLSSAGKCRRLCLALCWLGFVLGACCLVTGIFAVMTRQPYAVYYPLLLAGVLASAVLGGMIPMIRKRFEAHELRRMAAMDTGFAG